MCATARSPLRPIAGTRPRGETPARDRELAEELLADQKELAEHLMLLDLGRNDVGRVAEIGSVKVTDKFFVERYSQVMHIVSNVEGRLDKKYDVIDALVGGFPAGTVSGATQGSRHGRSLTSSKNTSAVHMLDASAISPPMARWTPASCSALAIVKDGKMYVQAGAGIVADSVAESEHQECINKGQGTDPRG